MTREEAIEFGNMWLQMNEDCKDSSTYMFFHIAVEALKQEPCEMTAEEYRQRMIQAFHNADCSELIALVVLPTEKEFEHLEWLLEKHYKAKPEPCTDAISRQAVLNLAKFDGRDGLGSIIHAFDVEQLPPVTPAEKVGQWIKTIGENGVTSAVRCSECGFEDNRYMLFRYCPTCGAKMEEVSRNDIDS